MRSASLVSTDRINHLYQDPHLSGVGLLLLYRDLTDGSAVRRVLDAVDPDEVYNLGAQSHVRVSFDMPEYTAEVIAVGALRLIEALFFFSSRRRHTRWTGDWSSDVCSSDLGRHRLDELLPHLTRAAQGETALRGVARGLTNLINGAVLYRHEVAGVAKTEEQISGEDRKSVV